MFKVSQRDVKQVAAYGIAGSLFFAAFAIGNMFTTKKIGKALCVETKTLHKDTLMRTRLYELEMICNDRVTYLRLIACIDRITNMCAELMSSPQSVDPFTRRLATMEYDQLESMYAPRIFEMFKEKHNESQVLDMECLLAEIMQQTHTYVKNIWLLTEKHFQYAVENDSVEKKTTFQPK